MNFSASELLALASIGRRADTLAQRAEQADAITEFVQVESLPSCALIRKRKWARAENARQQGVMRRLGKGAA